MTCFWRWAPLLAATVGCGARSEMQTPTGAGGSQGQASSTSVATTGSGAAPCTTFGPDPVVRSFDSQPDSFGHMPRLVATSADGEQVTLVVRSEPEPIPIDASPVLTQVTFHPWNAWSAEPLGRELVLAAGNEFVTPHVPLDGLWLWAFASTFATGPTMLLFEGAPIDVEYPANSVVLAFENRPSFVTGPTGEGTGLGYVSFAGGAEQANLGVMTARALTPYLGYACTLTKLWMDAVVVQGAVVAAVATPYPMSGCSAAVSIDVVRFGLHEPPVAIEIDSFGTTIEQVHMLPRSDGAWLVWQVGDSETSGPLMASQVVRNASPKFIELVPSGIVFETVGITSLGDGLAVAYTEAIDPGPPNIVVTTFNQDGAQRAQSRLTPPAWPRPGERYSLIASPAGDQLLLAWPSAMHDPDVAGSSQVYVARFDCAR